MQDNLEDGPALKKNDKGHQGMTFRVNSHNLPFSKDSVMRKLLLILTVLLAALPSRAQTDTLTLGYCKGQIAAKGRTTAQGKKWISGAIRLTSVTLSPFVDNKIVGVRVGLCSRVNIDTLQVWVRTTATGENHGARPASHRQGMEQRDAQRSHRHLHRG